MEYLAFDFGDGTTTVAHYDDSFAGKEPDLLTITKGQYEVWSCIGFDKQSKKPPVIGQSASRPDYEVKMNWKSYPSKYPKGCEDRKIAVAFMQKVFSSFLERNPNYKASPCKIVIGVPCDWNAEDMREYQEMAREAGIPNVDVIKESQAAMFFARSWMHDCVSDDAIRNGVLLIDVGSSTTDFTFMKGANVVHHKGIPLGAKYVEQMFLTEGMVRENVRYWPRPTESSSTLKLKVLANDKEEGIDAYNTDLMDVRLHKELYFTAADDADPKEWVGRLRNAPMSVGTNGSITPEFVDYCLNNEKSPCIFHLQNLSDEWTEADRKLFSECNSWRGHFRNVLRCIKTNWKIAPDTEIIVTGGATRMDFIEKDVSAVFQSKTRPHFGNDAARSFSVVKGLAWAAFAKDAIGQHREKLMNLITKDDAIIALLEKYVGDFLKKPTEEIAKNVKDKILPLLVGHKNEVGSLRKLNKKYSSVLCEEINRFFAKTNDGVDVSDLLSKPEIEKINSKLQSLFARPKIGIKKELTASIPWRWGRIELSFDPFEGCSFVRPSSMDQSFEGFFGQGMMYDNAANGFRKNFTADTVLEVFKSEDFTFNGATRKDVPSDFVRLMHSLMLKIYEFKMAELDAILGAFEYDKQNTI